jgi:preprotein translocase subunit Sss1
VLNFNCRHQISSANLGSNLEKIAYPTRRKIIDERNIYKRFSIPAGDEYITVSLIELIIRAIGFNKINLCRFLGKTSMV